VGKYARYITPPGVWRSMEQVMIRAVPRFSLRAAAPPSGSDRGGSSATLRAAALGYLAPPKRL
jgi:hypothetical protein